MFGFGGGATRQKRGKNIEIDVQLTFREAIFGVDKSIKLYRQTTCSTCKGNGAEPGTKIEDCKTCSGTGQTKQAQKTMFGVFHSVAPCKDCNGRGKKPEKPCHTCRGYGVEKREESISVRIPPGVDVDTVLQVSGQGETPSNGGKPGDLLVRIHVETDSRFEREMNDLLSVESIPFSVLALGGSVDIETIDGKHTIKIAEGTPTGTVITLRGMGVPYRNGGRGNQLVRLEAIVPRKLSKEQKALLEQIREQGL
jgi:molecular chaperone DnaJ